MNTNSSQIVPVGNKRSIDLTEDLEDNKIVKKAKLNLNEDDKIEIEKIKEINKRKELNTQLVSNSTFNNVVLRQEDYLGQLGVFRDLHAIFAQAHELKRYYQDKFFVFTHGQSTELSVINEYMHLLMKEFFPDVYHPFNVPFRIPETSETKTRAELFKRFNLDKGNKTNFVDNHYNFETLAVDPYFWNTNPGESASFFLKGNDNINFRHDKSIIYKIIRDVIINFLPHEYLSHYLANKINKIGMDKKQKTAIGTLYLICIPKDMINLLGYRSHPYGKKCITKTCYPANKKLEILKRLQCDERLTCKVKNNNNVVEDIVPQYRLLPALMAEKKEIRSFALNIFNKVDQKSYKTQLKNIFSEMMLYIKILNLGEKPSDEEVTPLIKKLENMLANRSIGEEIIGYFLSEKAPKLPVSLFNAFKSYQYNYNQIGRNVSLWNQAVITVITNSIARNWTRNRKLYNYTGEIIQTQIPLRDATNLSNEGFSMPHGLGELVLNSNDLIKTKYKGYFAHGCLNGGGTLSTNERNFITGIWRNNQLDYGKKQWIDHLDNETVTYRGYFKNLVQMVFHKIKPHGEGVWEKGTQQYRGQFNHGKRHGKGTLTDRNAIYEGTWENDQLKFGTCTIDSILIFEGEFAQNNQEMFILNKQPLFSKGRLSYPNGNVYKGSLNHKIREGEGILTLTNGKICRGLWKEDNCLSGELHWIEENRRMTCQAGFTNEEELSPISPCTIKVSLIDPDSNIHEGLVPNSIEQLNWYSVSFVHDNYHYDGSGKDAGFLRIIDSYGNELKYEGELKSFLPHGSGSITFPNGAKVLGHFVEGKSEKRGEILSRNSNYDGDLIFAMIDQRILPLPHGQGVWTSRSQMECVEYTGSFSMGIPNGNCELKVGNRCYQTLFTNGKSKNILVKELKYDQCVYNGEIKCSGLNQSLLILPDGEGTMSVTFYDLVFNGTFSEGTIKEGQFKNLGQEVAYQAINGTIEGISVNQLNMGDDFVYSGDISWTISNGESKIHLHGNGIKTYKKTGVIYAGQFQKNRRIGNGMATFPDGSIYRGIFPQGIVEGSGNWAFPNGTSYKGKIKTVDGRIVPHMDNEIGFMTYQNQMRYMGEFKDGTIDLDDGCLIYPNQVRYVGQLKLMPSQDSFPLPHGKGIMTDPGGIVYEGTFSEGKKEGIGKSTYRDGSLFNAMYTDDLPFNGIWTLGSHTYEGQVKIEYSNGILQVKAHGEGIMTILPGSTFKGAFVDGRLHGNGVRTFQDGSIFEGNYDNNKRKEGQWTFKNFSYIGEVKRIPATSEFKEYILPLEGIMTYGPGSTYEGPFSEGKRHGPGIRKYPDGSIFTGKFDNDKRTDEGTWEFNNGIKYQGRVAAKTIDGVENIYPEGKGILTYPDTSEYEGPFVNGKPNGIGGIKYSDGSQFEGFFDEVPKTGTIKVANNTFIGEVKETISDQGTKKILPHGRGGMEYGDGTKYDGEFFEGERHGRGVRAYPGVKFDGMFEKGRRTDQGTWIWENGITYNGGVKILADPGRMKVIPHGHGTMTFNTGGSYQGGFSEGKRHGWGIRLYGDGTRFEGQFQNDLRDAGYWRFSNGEIYTGQVIIQTISGIERVLRANKDFK